MNRALIASAVITISALLAGPAAAHLPRELSLQQAGETCTGKPVVVAQRNDAANDLRDGFHDAHKQLQSLRGGGKDVDHKAVNDTVKDADSALRERLTTALNDLAALTLGRNGQLGDTEDGDTEDGDTEEADTDEDNGDTDEDADTDEDTSEDSGEGGRPCDVPAPAADQGALDSLVEAALADMQQIVDDAMGALDGGDTAEDTGEDTAEVETSGHGNSGDHGKPDWAGQGKPEWAGQGKPDRDDD